MSRRKRQPVRRIRRSPYERSLEYAQNRLEKATVEREQCALKLAELDREIPYLQTVIHALTPANAKLKPIDTLVDMTTWGRAVLDVTKASPPIAAPSTETIVSSVAGQESYLARFVKPVEMPRVGGAVVAAPEIQTPFAGEEITEEIR